MSDSGSTTPSPWASWRAAGRGGPVEAQRDLAVFLARCYAGPGEVLDDLERATLIGLWKAARGSDPGRGASFATETAGALERPARPRAADRWLRVRCDPPEGAPPA